MVSEDGDAPVVVAAGMSLYGSWQVIARRGPDGQVSTAIKLIEPDGRVLWLGGSGGPLLWPGRILNVGSGGHSTGPYEVDVRVPPEVREVTITTADRNVLTIPLHDSGAFPEVRFGLLLVDRDLRLAHVTAFDSTGQEVDQFDMKFHQHVWHDR